MKWFFKRKANLSDAIAQRLQQLPAAVHDACLNERLVVVDVEATGLNTRKDNILAIGAVAVEQGGMAFKDTFYCVLNREHAVNDAVLIHRLGPETLARGVSVEEGLLAFLEFVGPTPLFAFHSPFDEQLLVRECKQHLKYRLAHTFVDVAQMAPLLTQEPLADATLDDWLTAFNLPMLERHNALADAYVTAKMLVMLLNKAHKAGIVELSQLKTALKRQTQQAQPAMF